MVNRNTQPYTLIVILSFFVIILIAGCRKTDEIQGEQSPEEPTANISVTTQPSDTPITSNGEDLSVAEPPYDKEKCKKLEAIYNNSEGDEYLDIKKKIGLEGGKIREECNKYDHIDIPEG